MLIFTAVHASCRRKNKKRTKCTSIPQGNTRCRLVCVPDPNIIWVCESPAIILYSDVAIFPRFGGKRDVTHLIYVKIKPYLISLLFLAKMAWFQTFPSESKRRNLFQNASKRQIKIIYFYVIKTPQYKIIAGDWQTHIILGSGTQTTLPRPNIKKYGPGNH